VLRNEVQVRAAGGLRKTRGTTAEETSGISSSAGFEIVETDPVFFADDEEGGPAGVPWSDLLRGQWVKDPYPFRWDAIELCSFGQRC
jgi:hypothetical protein